MAAPRPTTSLPSCSWVDTCGGRHLLPLVLLLAACSPEGLTAEAAGAGGFISGSLTGLLFGLFPIGMVILRMMTDLHARIGLVERQSQTAHGRLDQQAEVLAALRDSLGSIRAELTSVREGMDRITHHLLRSTTEPR